MRGPILKTLVATLAPGTLLLAADVPTMEPTPSVAPPVQSQLVDYVVPAYGMTTHRDARIDSRIEDLVHEIEAFTGSVETAVMAGSLHRHRTEYEIQATEQGLPVAVAEERRALPEEQQLADLAQRLAVIEEEMPYPNLVEKWQLEHAWRTLSGASELLRLGLSEAEYLRLEELHQAWLTYYHRHLALARAEYAQQLVEEQQMSPGSALAQARTEIERIDYPPMALDGEYPEIVIPEVMRPKDLPQQQPEPQPEPQPPAEPATAPEQPVSPAAPDAADAEFDAETHIAIADALTARGRELNQAAQQAGATDRRDTLYHQAQLILGTAVEHYSSVVEAHPSHPTAAGSLREANRLRSESIKHATTPAEDDAAAIEAAEAIVEEVSSRAAMGGTDAGRPAEPQPQPEPAPQAPQPEPEPEPQLPAPQPEPEPEPEPQQPAPQPEPEPEPQQPAPQPEPEPEQPADDDADDSLDDLDFPDL